MGGLFYKKTTIWESPDGIFYDSIFVIEEKNHVWNFEHSDDRKTQLRPAFFALYIAVSAAPIISSIELPSTAHAPPILTVMVITPARVFICAFWIALHTCSSNDKGLSCEDNGRTKRNSSPPNLPSEALLFKQDFSALANSTSTSSPA